MDLIFEKGHGGYSSRFFGARRCRFPADTKLGGSVFLGCMTQTGHFLCTKKDIHFAPVGTWSLHDLFTMGSLPKIKAL